MKLTIALLIGAAAVAAATGQVECGDLTTLSNGDICFGASESLESANINPADAVQIDEADEGATSMSFADPGTVDYIFTFQSQSGGFIFCFGMCVVEQLADQAAWDVINDVSSTEAELEVARLAFAKDCVVDDGAKGFKIFDERVDSALDTFEVTTLPSPISVVFWLLPNVDSDVNVNPIDTFQTNADAIYASSQVDSVRRPLFSVNAANQEGFDYVILFEGQATGNSRSLFLWEDKDRSSGQNQNNNDGSDSDFGDLVFAVNAILTPDVAPPTGPGFFCDPASQGGANPAVCTTDVMASSVGNSVTITWGPDGKQC